MNRHEMAERKKFFVGGSQKKINNSQKKVMIDKH